MDWHSGERGSVRSPVFSEAAEPAYARPHAHEDFALVSIQLPNQNVLRRALAGTAGVRESENLAGIDMK